MKILSCPGLIAAVLAAASVWSCVVPGGPSTGKGSPDVVPPGKGQLVVRWTPEPQGKALVGSAWAAANADSYELVLIGPSGARAVDLTLGAVHAVPADPGTYRVVVLAGVKKTPGSTTAYLAGSAAAEGVRVLEGQRTAVDLVLRSVDLSLGAKAPAYWKGAVTLVETGKTRNPRVGMSLAGASTTARPRFKSAELWNGYKEAGTVTGTPDDWAAEAQGTVPDGAASVTVGLVGAGILFQGLDDQWVPTAGTTRFSWFWPNRADLADTHVLASLTETVVPAGPPPTGVSVSLGWE